MARPPYHLLMRGFVFMVLIWVCMASPSEVEGSADSQEDTEEDKDGKVAIKLLLLGYMQPRYMTING